MTSRPWNTARRITPAGLRGRRQACGAGFTLVECLIGLAISAMLLAAVAVAFNASVINYGENEEMFATINNARQALTRMTTQLRTGHSVDPSAASNRCNFFTSANQNTSYLFQNGALYLIITASNGTEASHLMCNNVTDASFTKMPTDDGMDCKSVQISMTVSSGDFHRTLAGAAVIRRNLPF